MFVKYECGGGNHADINLFLVIIVIKLIIYSHLLSYIIFVLYWTDVQVINESSAEVFQEILNLTGSKDIQNGFSVIIVFEFTINKKEYWGQWGNNKDK